MSNGFLSQEEIDSLLNGGGNKQNDPVQDNTEVTSEVSASTESTDNSEDLSDIEKDLLGEIGNISMGSASTALSTIINQQVNITTPVVTVTTLEKLRDTFEVPNLALEVKYTSGIVGENLLVMKVADAGVIANLMMGGDGRIGEISELSEIEVSAVSEAMNQMIGSAATSMATMFAREVNISPPESKIWDDLTSPLSNGLDENETIVKVSFSLNIGDLVDSNIMQLLPIATAKKIVSIMMGQESPEESVSKPNTDKSPANVQPEPEKIQQQVQQQVQQQPVQPQAAQNYYNEPIYEKPIETPKPRVEVQQASFQPLGQTNLGTAPAPKNIDLIMDVPLEISVVLGKTKKSIKDILNFGTGSLIELDRLAEEPVEILVNGKKVAYGEVVVVDENFGVRITSIVSSEERIKSLGK